MSVPRRILSVMLVFLVASSLHADDELADRFAPYIDRAVDAIYRMHYDEADAALNTMAREVPGHPNPALGQAILVWVRFLYETERNDNELIRELDDNVALALSTAETWLKIHPDDALAWQARAAAHGLKGRQLLVEKRYIKAYREGRTAIKSLRKAVELNPDLYDAYLGLGAYDYYTIKEAKAHVFLGTLYWHTGCTDAALAAMTRAAQVRYKGKPSRWAVWAMIRHAQWLDLLDRRSEALPLYRKAIACADPWGYGNAAEQYLNHPFNTPDHHFPMWPDPEG